MANYHLKITPGSRQQGKSAHKKMLYIAREGQYKKHDDPVVFLASGNMPEFAQAKPSLFWFNADKFERKNARLYTELMFTLPVDLDKKERQALALRFAQVVTKGRLPFTLAIHHGNGHNPHVHLMISERMNDGVERDKSQFFKRYNPKNPAKGGAKKDRSARGKKWVFGLRKLWETLTNEALAAAGVNERVSADSRLVASTKEAAKIQQKLDATVASFDDSLNDFLTMPLAPIFQYFDTEVEEKRKKKKLLERQAEELKKRIAEKLERAEEKQRVARLGDELRQRVHQAAKRLNNHYAPDLTEMARRMNAAYSDRPKATPKLKPADNDFGMDFD